MREKSNIVDYASYCLLYVTTIICNKYVLSSLGFQYPTVFQAWQTFVSLVLIQMVSGKLYATHAMNLM